MLLEKPLAGVMSPVMGGKLTRSVASGVNMNICCVLLHAFDQLTSFLYVLIEAVVAVGYRVCCYSRDEFWC